MYKTLFILRLYCYLAFLLLLASCSLIDLGHQTKTINVSGKVYGCTASNTHQSIVVIDVFKKHKFNLELIQKKILDAEGCYELDLLPGEYLLELFVDLNGDHLFNNGEPKSTYFDAQGQLTYVQIDNKETLSLPPIKFYKENVNYELSYEKFIGKQISNIGLIKNIDDPMFIDKNVSLGMWKPLDFMNDIGGGVFMTEPYNENKIPILFIHGILGSPTNFKVLIGSIDLSKYQPWVFFYASALPLGVVSDHLLYSLKALEMKYKFESIDLISHSAGGLVTRSLILKNYNSGSSFKVNNFITINSPLAGMDSASKGVKYSPIVIPSWRDISSSSNFIKNIHRERLPKSVHYNLIFSHKNNKDGDGVVPMKSELLLSSEYEAEEVIGFESGHLDILTNDKFIAWFNKKLTQ